MSTSMPRRHTHPENSLDLFASPAHPAPAMALGEQAWILPGFAAAQAGELLAAVQAVTAQAPWRHQQTPGGRRIAVAMSNCGALGWTSDRGGYRYQQTDPDTGTAWPPIPGVFTVLASHAAAAAGFGGFAADTALINRYRPGVGMGLHQDRDERDMAAPIVSLSLGMDAIFLFGGLQRSDRPQRIRLRHGDAVVWGGVDRLRFHGVAPLRGPPHPLLGEQRLNITLRKAG